MDEKKPDHHDFECVEPALGDEMWRLDSPALDAALHSRLDNHLMVCDACRIRRATEARIAAGLSDGTLVLPRTRPLVADVRRPRMRVMAWSGGLAVAASLLLLMVMSPRARDDGRIVRSADEPRFLRPVEGEVVSGGHPRLSWAPIEGASAYRLTISEVGGDYAWRGETADHNLTVPASAALPLARDYRAFLEPVPADLAQPGGVTVSFRAGDLREHTAYRLAASSPWIKVLGLAGVFLLLGATVLRLVYRSA